VKESKKGCLTKCIKCILLKGFNQKTKKKFLHVKKLDIEELGLFTAYSNQNEKLRFS
jgi:hypothetical protein